MTPVGRLERLWVDGVGINVAVGLIALMSVVVGTPAWWVSLLATAGVCAVVGIWLLRVRDVPRVPAAVVVCLIVVAVAAGLVGVSVHGWSDARSVVATRDEVARVGAQTVCRVIERGTPARQAAALAAATGDLADRLRSGAAALGPVGDESVCRPVTTGVADASIDAADVVVVVAVTADGATGERAIAAGLRRVDGRWAVATLQVVR